MPTCTIWNQTVSHNPFPYSWLNLFLWSGRLFTMLQDLLSPLCLSFLPPVSWPALLVWMQVRSWRRIWIPSRKSSEQIKWSSFQMLWFWTLCQVLGQSEPHWIKIFAHSDEAITWSFQHFFNSFLAVSLNAITFIFKCTNKTQHLCIIGTNSMQTIGTAVSVYGTEGKGEIRILEPWFISTCCHFMFPNCKVE